MKTFSSDVSVFHDVSHWVPAFESQWDDVVKVSMTIVRSVTEAKVS